MVIASTCHVKQNGQSEVDKADRVLLHRPQLLYDGVFLCVFSISFFLFSACKIAW